MFLETVLNSKAPSPTINKSGRHGGEERREAFPALFGTTGSKRGLMSMVGTKYFWRIHFLKNDGNASVLLYISLLFPVHCSIRIEVKSKLSAGSYRLKQETPGKPMTWEISLQVIGMVVSCPEKKVFKMYKLIFVLIEWNQHDNLENYVDAKTEC